VVPPVFVIHKKVCFANDLIYALTGEPDPLYDGLPPSLQGQPARMRAKWSGCRQDSYCLAAPATLWKEFSGHLSPRWQFRISFWHYTQQRKCVKVYSRSRRCGNKITSRIFGVSVSSMISRSIPIPNPPFGGIPYRIARR